MTIFDVVLVPFPFSDLSSNKKRPCLILAESKPKSFGRHFIVTMITSRIHGLKFPFDVFISDKESCGLPVESIIRLSKVVTIEEKIIKKKLGTLSKKDLKNLKEEFNKMYQKLLS